MIRTSEDPALKMIRVGDALCRAGRLREALAVYRRAAMAFEAQRRVSHARAAWRLVLKIEPDDAQACARVVELGGLPGAPEHRAGFATRVVQLDPEEVERTTLGEEMYEITDAGFADDPVGLEERTAPGAPVTPAARPMAPSRAPVGFVSTGTKISSTKTAVLFEDFEHTVTSPERTDPA